ncbi:MAG: response regulator transcription factor [Ferruginibacter sp.]|nr:response regulator transcription factor [Ferruginibacter sp.]
MSKIKILIVEDEPVIAENISLYLDNNDFEVSGIAYDSEDAMQQLKENTPDAVLLDINLESDTDGIDIARYIQEHYQLPFIFLTSYSDRSTLERAKQVKPSGYIVKPFNERTLLASLEIAISNHAEEANHALPKLVMEKVNRQLHSPLSEREFELSQMIYEGKTNTQIAETLFITVNTVKTHLKSIYLKLDAGTRIEVIRKLQQAMLR